MRLASFAWSCMLRDRLLGVGGHWFALQGENLAQPGLEIKAIGFCPNRMRKNSLFPSSQSVLIEYDAPRAMNPAKEAQHARD